MRWWPFAERKGATDLSLDALIARLDDAYRTLSGIAVTPETSKRE